MTRNYRLSGVKTWNLHVPTSYAKLAILALALSLALAPAPAPAPAEPHKMSTQEDDVSVKARLARVYTNINYCYCPGSEPGKIGPPSSHLRSCKHSKSKTIDIAVIKDETFGAGWVHDKQL